MSLMIGQEIVVSPLHPFYGGVRGLFEFTLGEKDEILVFSKPLDTADEPKIYFMLRPDDVENYTRQLAFLLQDQQSEDSIDLEINLDPPVIQPEPGKFLSFLNRILPKGNHNE